MSNINQDDKVTLKKMVIFPDSPQYPIDLKAKIIQQPILTVLGNLPDNLANSLALLSSAKAPASILLAVHDLAQQWRHGALTIISGFHSPVEQEAFEVLLRGPGRIIYCPARGLPKRLKPVWRTALGAERLTIISPFAETVRRATKETAVMRNRVVAAFADEVLIAYAHPSSSTEQLAKEVLSWGKRVYTLPHGQNAYMQQLGVLAFAGEK